MIEVVETTDEEQLWLWEVFHKTGERVSIYSPLHKGEGSERPEEEITDQWSSISTGRIKERSLKRKSHFKLLSFILPVRLGRIVEDPNILESGQGGFGVRRGWRTSYLQLVLWNPFGHSSNSSPLSFQRDREE